MRFIRAWDMLRKKMKYLWKDMQNSIVFVFFHFYFTKLKLLLSMLNMYSVLFESQLCKNNKT